ncbi:methyltransferase domain-containing protein [Eubacteriaceae bacterium ES3]|nr:methyltransferase domain-containing protein [Eubacteriaceae bacterium ES3]
MDKKTEQSRQSYNLKAKDYQNSPEGRFTLSYNHLISQQALLRDGDTILDVACGDGRMLQMLARQAEVNAYGIDVSEEMIKTARAANEGMVFQVATADQMPFKNDQFDLLTVCCAFHHFTRPAAFMAEAYRIIKPGGQLLIADPCLPPVIRQLENLFLPFLKMGDVKCYNQKELRDFYEESGFKKISAIKKRTQLLMTGVKIS